VDIPIALFFYFKNTYRANLTLQLKNFTKCALRAKSSVPRLILRYSWGRSTIVFHNKETYTTCPCTVEECVVYTRDHRLTTESFLSRTVRSFESGMHTKHQHIVPFQRSVPFGSF